MWTYIGILFVVVFLAPWCYEVFFKNYGMCDNCDGEGVVPDGEGTVPCKECSGKGYK